MVADAGAEPRDAVVALAPDRSAECGIVPGSCALLLRGELLLDVAGEMYASMGGDDIVDEGLNRRTGDLFWFAMRGCDL